MTEYKKGEVVGNLNTPEGREMSGKAQCTIIVTKMLKYVMDEIGEEWEKVGGKDASTLFLIMMKEMMGAAVAVKEAHQEAWDEIYKALGIPKEHREKSFSIDLRTLDVIYDGERRKGKKKDEEENLDELVETP